MLELDWNYYDGRLVNSFVDVPAKNEKLKLEGGGEKDREIHL